MWSVRSGDGEKGGIRGVREKMCGCERYPGVGVGGEVLPPGGGGEEGGGRGLAVRRGWDNAVVVEVG